MQFEFLSFVTIWVLSFVTISFFKFCHNLSFWILSHLEFLFLVSVSVFEFCQNLSFWVLSQFEFLSLVTIWVFWFFSHILSFRVLSQFFFITSTPWQPINSQGSFSQFLLCFFFSLVTIFFWVWSHFFFYLVTIFFSLATIV